MHDSNVPVLDNDTGATIEGPPKKWSFTLQRDWTHLVAITPGAHRFYCVLRSLIPEDGMSEDGVGRTRAFTLDELCWMMTPPDGRTVGESTVKDWRTECVRAGLIDHMPGRQRNGPARYIVRDVPAEGFVGWRNGWDKARAYRPDWRINRPSTTDSKNGHIGGRIPGGNTRSAGNPSASAGNPSGTDGFPAVTPPLTCADAPPKKPFKQAPQKALSLSPQAGQVEAGALSGQERERDEGRRRERPVPAPDTRPVLLTAREAAQEAIRRLKGEPGGKVKATIVEGLEKAIQEGLPPSRAVSWLNGKIGDKAHSPELIHATNVENLPDPRPGDVEVCLRELCTGCDERGATDNPAFTSGPGSSVCLHGRPPRKKKAAAKCGRCPRAVMSPAATLCGRCQRETGTAPHEESGS